MKIAVITTGFSRDENDFGGAAALHNFVKELASRKGVEVNVFALYYPLDRQEYDFYNAKVFSFAAGTSGKISKLKIWSQCKRKFIKEHLNGPFNLIQAMWLGESGYVASQLSKKLNIPLVAANCGGELAAINSIGYGSQLKFWQRYFVNKTIKLAKAIVAGSDFIIDRIKNYHNGMYINKIVKIPYGVDSNIFHSKPSSPSLQGEGVRGRGLCLINIANVLPVKAHNDLLNAFKIVVGEFPNARLICCGIDEKRTLKNIINQSGLIDNVQLPGFVEYEKIPEMLNNSDVYVLSSLYESQNMSLLEAAFCGLPVVSTDVGVANEITSHVVSPGDYKNLAKTIIHVIKNYSEEKKIAEDLINDLIHKFSLKTCVDKYLELYKSMIVKLN